MAGILFETLFAFELLLSVFVKSALNNEINVPWDLAVRHLAKMPYNNATETVHNVDAPDSLPIEGFVIGFDGVCPGR